MYKRTISAISAIAAAAVSLVIAGQAAAASAPPQAGGRSAGVTHVPREASSRPAGSLQPGNFQPKFPALAVTGPTVPYYRDTFSYAGTTYHYASVGTDPRTSTATTTVPVTFIPVKLLEASGVYSYPTGAITGITGSALFRNSSVTGGTQYGDATLRSSYWSYVKALKSKWHVRLGRPAITALQTISVPSNQGSYVQELSGDVALTINLNWYAGALDSLAAGYTAKNLVIILTYDAIGCADYTNLNTCGTGGFHTDTVTSTGTHTYAWASWLDSALLGAASADTAPMSHEIAEWLNDPFANDIVPQWAVSGEPQYGCSDLFEVGDPLVGHVFTIKGMPYQDEADFSWFTRQSPSIGFDGRYSYWGTFTSYSPSC